MRPQGTIDEEDRVTLPPPAAFEEWKINLEQLKKRRDAAASAVEQAQRDLNDWIAKVRGAGLVFADGVDMATAQRAKDSLAPRLIHLQQEQDALNRRAQQLEVEFNTTVPARDAARAAWESARDALLPLLRTLWSKATESVGVNNVVDGLELYRRWSAGKLLTPPRWDGATIPWGSEDLGLPLLDSTAGTTLTQVLERLAETLDSVGDCLVAESVFQLVQGNTTRAGATLDAIAKGEAPPPELEVVKTPTSGVAVTHRIVAVWPIDMKSSPQWDAHATQMRALAEPALNTWVEHLLPSPKSVLCQLETREKDNETAIGTEDLRLDVLGLSALDALYLQESTDQAQQSELEQRLHYYWASTHPDSVSHRIVLRFQRQPDWPAEALSVAEWRNILRIVRAFVTGARSADRRDFVLPQSAKEAGIDVEELQRRTVMAVASLRARRETLKGVTDSLGEDLALIQKALFEFASFGLVAAIPVPGRSDSAYRDQLLNQSELVLREVDRRLHRWDELEGMGAGTDQDALVKRYREQLKAVFGEEFHACPRFTIQDPPAVAAAFANQDELLGSDLVAPLVWLGQMAHVRNGVRRFQRAMSYAQALNVDFPMMLKVGQLPVRDHDRWVALPFADGQSVQGGSLSVVMHAPPGLAFDRPLVGVCIDEWVEVIPQPSHVTGMALHYDQPDARAPQTMLLAVPPDLGQERTQAWDVDTLRAILEETKDLSKIRVVNLLNRMEFTETVWMEDSLPAGAVPHGDGEGWNWIADDPVPYASRLAHRSDVVEGWHQHLFSDAKDTLPIHKGDRLFAYVFLDATHPPTQIILQWTAGNDGWEHRAYWGTNKVPNIKEGSPNLVLMGPLPPAGQWVRLDVPADVVGLEGKSLSGMAFTLWDGAAAWDRAGKVSRELHSGIETIWVRDSIPAGAIHAGELWNWITENPRPFSCNLAHESASMRGLHQHVFEGTTEVLRLEVQDRLFAYVFLDPNDRPSEVMLQWKVGAADWEHRAYWGEDKIAWGVTDTPSRFRVGPLPPAGKWVRLEVTAGAVGLAGKMVNGMAFTLFDGRAAWDRAGKTSSAGLYVSADLRTTLARAAG